MASQPAEAAAGFILPSAAASLLKTTPEALAQLAKAGKIPKLEDGAYHTARLIQAYVDHLSSDEIGAGEASETINVSAERIRQLVAEGYITKIGTKGGANVYSRKDLVLGYIRFLKDDERRTSKSATASRIGEARTKEIELRIQKQEHRICDTEDAIGVVEEIVGLYRSELSAMPARLARHDITLRRQIEKSVNGILDRVSATFTKRAHALRTGGEAFEVDTEDAA